MNAGEIPLKRRFLIFLSLWIAAGVIWATFSDFAVEAGDSKLAAQCAMVYMGPFMAAQGFAFVALPGGYNSWPSRQFLEGALCWVFVFLFLLHALITLSRKGKKQFLFWTAIQVVFLIASVACVLYYWHWDALHMHG